MCTFGDCFLSRNPAGYCFVEFGSADAAQRAMLKLNGKIIPGTAPVCNAFFFILFIVKMWFTCLMDSCDYWSIFGCPCYTHHWWHYYHTMLSSWLERTSLNSPIFLSDATLNLKVLQCQNMAKNRSLVSQKSRFTVFVLEWWSVVQPWGCKNILSPFPGPISCKATRPGIHFGHLPEAMAAYVFAHCFFIYWLIGGFMPAKWRVWWSTLVTWY